MAKHKSLKGAATLSFRFLLIFWVHVNNDLPTRYRYNSYYETGLILFVISVCTVNGNLMVEHAHDHGLLLFVRCWFLIAIIIPTLTIEKDSVQQTIVIERFGVICPWDGVCTLWFLVPLPFSRSHWSLLLVHVLCYVVIKQLHSNEILFTG